MPKNVGLPALLRPTSKGGGPATTDSGNDLAALVPAHSLESQRRRVGASDEPVERLGQRLESFPGGAAATLQVLERSRRTQPGVVAKRAEIGNESLVPANVRVMGPTGKGEERIVAEAAHVKREPGEDARLHVACSKVVAEAIAAARRVHEQELGQAMGIENHAGSKDKSRRDKAPAEDHRRKQHASLCELVVKIAVHEDKAGRSEHVPSRNPDPSAMHRRPLAGEPHVATMPENP